MTRSLLLEALNAMACGQPQLKNGSIDPEGWRDLMDRINDELSRPSRVVISVNGGVVDCVFADDPDLSVLIVDHDDVAEGDKPAFETPTPMQECDIDFKSLGVENYGH